MWDGRSSKPAETGAAVVVEPQTFVTFAAPFAEAPDIQLPTLPEGVTASLGEVTTEGFVLTVERAVDADTADIEWIATTPAAPTEETP
jgi:hypothetical protein